VKTIVWFDEDDLQVGQGDAWQMADGSFLEMKIKGIIEVLIIIIKNLVWRFFIDFK
jgi:hypothetical protein